MHVLLVSRTVIPVFAYGGTERVIWDLAWALTQLGHQVTFLVSPGSSCPFARVLALRDDKPLAQQIPADVDVVHFHYFPSEALLIRQPHLFTQHGNSELGHPLPLNTVFLSRNHAERHGATCFVYNGLNWDAYGEPASSVDAQSRYHFLGKAAWRVKNVRGAIQVARAAKVELDVLGGDRLNIKRGFRWTWSPAIHFHGMVGGARKFDLLRASKGLIFPVRWHEPFGLAVIESMFYGAPVFATPYGAIPELVGEENGVLAADAQTLARAIKTFEPRPKHARDRVLDLFSASAMASAYVRLYERVGSGSTLSRVAPVMAEPAVGLAWS